MTAHCKALLVHCLTASGAVWAMLAMFAAIRGEWSLMFLWLMVAFIVDGLDGPLARRLNVRANAGEIDGNVLDSLVDYLNYIFVPAFALYSSGLIQGWDAWVIIIVITFASALYMADTRMKTDDNSFAGFPACWNMVAIVVFALQPNDWVILLVIITLAITMFTPLKFIHPVRTRRWRVVSLPMAVAWTLQAGVAAWMDFAPNVWIEWGLLATSLYLLTAGILQQLLPIRAFAAPP